MEGKWDSWDMNQCLDGMVALARCARLTRQFRHTGPTLRPVTQAYHAGPSPGLLRDIVVLSVGTSASQMGACLQDVGSAPPAPRQGQ